MNLNILFCLSALELLDPARCLDAETGTVGPREERIGRGGNKRVQPRKRHKVRLTVTQSAEK